MFLSDGSWRTLEEAAKSLRTTQGKAKAIAELLQEFGFIQSEGRNLRITYDTREFLEAALTELNKAHK